MTRRDCPHVLGLNDVPQEKNQCESCGSKSNLRICMQCGYVGCCESQQAHNRQHALAEHHPVIRSLPLSSSSFTWCYDCRDYVTWKN